MTQRSSMSSSLMEWGKLHSRARFHLAASGVMNYPLSELPVRIEDIELSGPNSYGYEPLVKLLAKLCGVRSECLVHATGTSMANHLAMAASFDPGDEVLIEHPTYEPLLTTASYLGAKIRRFKRQFEDGFRIDLREVADNLTPRTRLIVITNLHNPSGVRTDLTKLEQLAEIARDVGARILVDEVFMDITLSQTTPSLLHLAEQQFIVTSSLTKSCGLSGLRCGWALAEPTLARRMWRLNDLYGVNAAHPAERLTMIALENLTRIGGQARILLETNRAIVKRFLNSRPDLDAIWPEYGTIIFPRLRGGQVERLEDILRNKYETSIVPGRFFEMPEHFRFGFGCETQTLIEGLDRLSAALDDLAR